MNEREQLFHDAEWVEKKLSDFCEQNEFPVKGAMLALVRIAARCGWRAEVRQDSWERMCSQVYAQTKDREEK